MGELFLTVITISATSSLVLLPLLLLARRIQSRYAAKTMYLLWLLLALRLMIPVQLPLPRPAVTVEAPAYTVRIPAVSRSADSIPTPTAPSQQSGGAQGMLPGPAVPQAYRVGWTEAAAFLWLSGAGIFLACQMIPYLLARRRLLRSAEGTEEALVYRSALVGAPMAMGLFRPVVFLPEREIPQEELALALLHERCHIRRHDIWYKGLFLLCNAAHWFNPLVWWMRGEAGRSVELCCDDQVLGNADAAARRRYGDALLHAAAGRGAPALSTRFGSGKRRMKERLENLFQKKRNSAALVCAALAAALLLGSLVACEGAPQDNQQEELPQAEDTSVSYTDTDYGFTLRLPESWAGAYAVREEEGLRTFYQESAMQEDDPTRGVLLSLCITTQGGFDGLYGGKDLDGIYANGGPRILVLGFTGDRLVYLHIDPPVLEEAEEPYRKMVQDGLTITPEDFEPLESAVDRTDLEACISDAILSRHRENGLYGGDLLTESHVNLKTVDDGDRVTVYTMAMYNAFTGSAAGFSEGRGGNMPVALTFLREEDGTYRLTEYWVPADGEDNWRSLRDRFPDDIPDEDLSTQTFVLAQTQSCYAQAIQYWNIDTVPVIEALFETIMSSPAAASNPGAYIDAHALDYRELTYYGDYALGYCIAEFEKGGQTGLKGALMAILCQDLLGVEGDSGGTGQDWYDANYAEICKYPLAGP